MQNRNLNLFASRFRNLVLADIHPHAADGESFLTIPLGPRSLRGAWRAALPVDATRRPRLLPISRPVDRGASSGRGWRTHAGHPSCPRNVLVHAETSIRVRLPLSFSEGRAGAASALYAALLATQITATSHLKPVSLEDCRAPPTGEQYAKCPGGHGPAAAVLRFVLPSTSPPFLGRP